MEIWFLENDLFLNLLFFVKYPVIYDVFDVEMNYCCILEIKLTCLSFI